MYKITMYGSLKGQLANFSMWTEALSRNIYESNELEETVTCADFAQVADKRFFSTVQNKMHYVVHGNTAAEVVVTRADHTKSFAESEFEQYRTIQGRLHQSDFYRLMAETNSKNK